MSKTWPTVRLGEVLKRAEEIVTVTPDVEYREVTVKLWGKGVVLRGIVSGAQIAGNRRFVAKAGQLILSRIDARNGAVGIMPPELNGAVVTNDFPLFDVDRTMLETAFLGWFSKTRNFVDLCRRASEGTTNRVRLQEDRFFALEIPLPPLAEQQRIVARIEALATKIAEACSLRHQAVEEAETLAQAAGESVFQQLRREHSSVRLADVCESVTDGDHNTPQFTDEGIRFIFVGNVSTGRLHLNNCKYVSPDYFKTLKPQRVPRRGDVLYSAVGATLGVPAVVDTDEPFCFQRHVAILRPDWRRTDSVYIWHMLRSRTVFEKAWSSTTGSAQPTVPLRAIRELPILIPPLPEQRRIVAYLDGLQAKSDELKSLQSETAAELDALLPAVLDRAFKGEL